MDKEKLIKEFEEICNYTMRPHEFRVLNDVLALLKEQDCNYCGTVFDVAYKAGKADAVVRCKDCKWWDKKDDANYGYCHACKHGYYSDHWEIGIYRTYKGDWFCADGERRGKECEDA